MEDRTRCDFLGDFRRIGPLSELGRALGHFIFSLIGLKSILFTNIFQKH